DQRRRPATAGRRARRDPDLRGHRAPGAGRAAAAAGRRAHRQGQERSGDGLQGRRPGAAPVGVRARGRARIRSLRGARGRAAPARRAADRGAVRRRPPGERHRRRRQRQVAAALRVPALARRRRRHDTGGGRPLLIVVEDLHWVDAASDEYLTRLVDDLEDAPVLLIATHRPDWRPRWGTPECVTSIVLPPLSEGDSLTLVGDVVARTQLPESLVRAILDRADGNPLFLEELARAVAEQGDLPQAPSVPDSLRAVLSARIDRLPDAQKRLLQTAAVLGREFSRPLLESIWGGPGSVAAHLAELTRLDFVHELAGG